MTIEGHTGGPILSVSSADDLTLALRNATFTVERRCRLKRIKAITPALHAAWKA